MDIVIVLREFSGFDILNIQREREYFLIFKIEIKKIMIFK